MKIQVMNVEVALCSQGTNYLEHLKATVGTVVHKLRITIYSDAMRSQSRCEIERFGGALEWKSLACRPAANMETPAHLCYNPEIWQAEGPKRDKAIIKGSKADREWLLARAEELLP